MADVSVPSIATATPDGDDTVLGVKDGIVKRFSLDNVGAGINFSAVNATTNMVFNTNGTEKMRLDSSGNLGVGTNSPATKLNVSGAPDGTYNAQVTIGNTGAGAQKIAFLPTVSSGLGGLDDGSLAFYASGANSERMRIDSSGNVGIGTSSPAYKLSVGGDIAVLSQNTLRLQNSDNTNAYALQNAGASGGGNAYLSFVQTGVAERMRIDSAGNLGLGVTPSAWGSAFKAFELSSGALMADNTATTLYILQNSYFSGSAFLYKNTGTATKVEQVSGQFRWFNAAFGTAGAAITFTQAMTLDASGKLQLNTTSTAGGYFTLNTLAQSGLDIYRSDSSANYSGIRFRDTTNANTYGQIGWDSTGLRLDGVAGNVYFSTSGTERARIDGSGNLIQTVNTTAATLTTNSTLTFSIVDNSTLRISVRGSDGTTRTATVALT